MKTNGLKLGTLIVALGTACLCAEDVKKAARGPLPMPPVVDAQTIAARRAKVMERLAQAQATAARSNELAQGAPGLSKGSESGGQTSASNPSGLAGAGAASARPAALGLSPLKSSPAVAP